MPQNIYDDQSFFVEYNKLSRSQEGLEGAPEWPSLRRMVGSVQDSHVLDLGCGYGWFCRWARENGAKSVEGIDLSRKMLDKALSDWPRDPAIAYKQGDLDLIELSAQQYALVYSSLAFHYLQDVRTLFRKVYGGLVSGGGFVFSIEHPIFTAPLKPPAEDSEGQSAWSLDSYQFEGERVREWLGGKVEKQHRTLTTYIAALLEAGFRLTAFEEWRPSEEDLSQHPKWIMQMHRPVFLLIAARKD